jgi:hypothetical protein
VYLDGLTRLSALEDFTAYETAENWKFRED